VYYVVILPGGLYYWRDVRGFTPHAYRNCVTRDCAFRFLSETEARSELEFLGIRGFTVEAVPSVESVPDGST
jgi:hypothetical protein